MRQIIIVIIVVGFTPFLSAAQDQPEPVLSIVRQPQMGSWYMKQFDLWGEILREDPKNEDAWIYHYAAARMAGIIARNDASMSAEKWESRMDSVITEMELNIPGTYAFYRLKSWHHRLWDPEYDKNRETIIGYTYKAYEMEPSSPDVYPNMANILKTYRKDEQKLKEVFKNWIASGDFSPTLLARNYNMLASTKKNAILITGGDNDTYPAWALQSAKEIRTDVTVVNFYLCQVPEYRKRAFAELGIPEFEEKPKSISELIGHIIEHRGDHPLYFSTKAMLPQDTSLHDNLYNVGIVFQYSEEDINNTSLLIDNFENKYLMDYLEHNFGNSSFPELDRRFNYGYIPGLVTLYNHYMLIEDQEKAEATRKLVIKLVSEAPFEEDVLQSIGIE